MHTVRVVVDRIEGEIAVLLVGPEEIKVDFPTSCLPELHEGMVFAITFRENRMEEGARRAEVESLLKRLTKR